MTNRADWTSTAHTMNETWVGGASSNGTKFLANMTTSTSLEERVREYPLEDEEGVGIKLQTIIFSGEVHSTTDRFWVQPILIQADKDAAVADTVDLNASTYKSTRQLLEFVIDKDFAWMPLSEPRHASIITDDGSTSTYAVALKFSIPKPVLRAIEGNIGLDEPTRKFSVVLIGAFQANSQTIKFTGFASYKFKREQGKIDFDL